MRLCSACLLGIKCRYDGKGKPNEEVLAIAKNEVLIPVCPEQLGGQTTPRPNAEIKEGNGYDVLDKKVVVVEPDGNDVTDFFCKRRGGSFENSTDIWHQGSYSNAKKSLLWFWPYLRWHFLKDID